VLGKNAPGICYVRGTGITFGDIRNILDALYTERDDGFCLFKIMTLAWVVS
jgi:hypothetical protein